MSKIKIFDIAEEIIKEATEQFYPIFELNDERIDIFKQYCEVMDLFGEETGAEGYSVDVNDKDMSVKIGIICSDFQICDNYKSFCDLLARTTSFSVSHDEESDDLIEVSFTYPSLWNKAW